MTELLVVAALAGDVSAEMVAVTTAATATSGLPTG
jgi:hypothetical protein